MQAGSWLRAGLQSGHRLVRRIRAGRNPTDGCQELARPVTPVITAECSAKASTCDTLSIAKHHRDGLRRPTISSVKKCMLRVLPVV